MNIIKLLNDGLLFFFVLSVLVLIHEFGHYLIARLIGVKVEEFGFGLPPKIFGKKFKFAENEWSLNWLPIGGFVRLAGEDQLENSVEATKKKFKGKNISRYFWARTKLERGAILLAGVTMNFLLAWGITSYLVTQGIDEPSPRVKITDVIDNTPAKAAGLMAGDSVEAIKYVTEKGNEQTVDTRLPQELYTAIRSNLGKQISLKILRNGQEIFIPVTPRKDFPSTEGPTGIHIDFDIKTIKYPWYQAPWVGLKLTVSRGKDMLYALASLPVRAIQGQNVKDEVSGPIGIAQVTSQAAEIGPQAVLNLMSLLSLSLAMLNVLPIPALDGGRLFFIVIEAVTGKAVKANFEQRAHQIGMLALLSLIGLITLNDILKLIHF